MSIQTLSDAELDAVSGGHGGRGGGSRPSRSAPLIDLSARARQENETKQDNFKGDNNSTNNQTNNGGIVLTVA